MSWRYGSNLKEIDPRYRLPESANNTRSKKIFRTRHGVVNILDKESIKTFQRKAGVVGESFSRIGPITKAAIIRELIDPSDIGAVNRALPNTAKRNPSVLNEDTDNSSNK